MSDAPPSAPPIVDLVMDRLELDGETYVLGADGRTALEAALKDEIGKPGLREAVRGLLVFAFFVEHQKRSPKAAAVIIDVLKSAKTAMAAAKVRLDDEQGAVTAERDARKLLGMEAAPAPATPVSDAPAMKWWEARTKGPNDD